MPSGKTIRQLDMPVLDEVFEMGGGYVLDFSNATFHTFFATEIGVNIDDHRFCTHGTSKAKRLRCFLLQANQAQALKTLTTLWEYRALSKLKDETDKLSPRVQEAYFSLIARLGGTRPESETPKSIEKIETVDRAVYEELSSAFRILLGLKPHPRGYAFERFLNDLFTAFNLTPRPSFRLRGEQIDGSFNHAGHTYLLEAKWTNGPADAATLRSFNAKVEDKAKWSRGLFVSYTGFTVDGLHAFGRGRSLICMDGLDLHEVLERQLDFVQVIEMKTRLAAETGAPFSPVRDITI